MCAIGTSSGERVAGRLRGRARDRIVELDRDDAHLVVGQGSEDQIRLDAAAGPEALAVDRALTARTRVAELHAGRDRVAPADAGHTAGLRLAAHLHLATRGTV